MDDVAESNDEAVPMQPFKQRLQDKFLPWDEAAWHLGTVLGLWPDVGETYAEFKHRWGARWHLGTLGDLLYDTLTAMNRADCLVRRKVGDDYEFMWGKQSQYGKA